MNKIKILKKLLLGVIATILILVLINVVSLVLIFIPLFDYDGPWQNSPSGDFQIKALVNRTDSDLLDYARVKIILATDEHVILQEHVSDVGDAQKWALGWMPNEDVVILQSADVRSKAFIIEDNKLIELDKPTKAMCLRAKELKSLKYNVKPHNRC